MLPSSRCLARRSASSRSSPEMPLSACNEKGGVWEREGRRQSGMVGEDASQDAGQGAGRRPHQPQPSTPAPCCHRHQSAPCVPPPWPLITQLLPAVLGSAAPRSTHLACLLRGLVLLLARVGKHLLEAGGPVRACRAQKEGGEGGNVERAAEMLLRCCSCSCSLRQLHCKHAAAHPLAAAPGVGRASPAQQLSQAAQPGNSEPRPWQLRETTQIIRAGAHARTRGVELWQRGVQLAAQVGVHGHKGGLLHRVLKHLADSALQQRRSGSRWTQKSRVCSSWRPCPLFD